MSVGGLNSGLFQAFIDYLYSSGNITVPADFHSRCSYIKDMLDNDYSGLINTLLDYAVNSASEANYRVECENETLEDILNKWLQRVNINIDGVPTGLQELAREYYKERWLGSSLCLMRVSNWEDIEIGQNKISVPTVLWFVNGASVYIKRDNEEMFKLGSDKYYLDAGLKNALPSKKDENIFVQKPFDRWFAKYPVPYLIRKGVVKNYLGVREIQRKGDEVITKVLPYLFVIEKGTQELFQAGVEYNDADLEKLVDNFKDALERYKNEGAKTPANAVPFDQKYQHLIPDLRNILTEELYRQGSRAILSGLGFVDVIQGISSSRKESVLNPRPFITEVNAGVDGFKNLLLDIINLIIVKNNTKHRKFFSESNDLYIVSSPIKINVEDMIDAIRSGYDRGTVSIQTYIESLGFDFETEKERRQKELDNALEDLFYPHLVVNQEGTPDERIAPAKPRTTKKENLENENKSGPEKKNFKNAEIAEDLTIAPYNKESYPEYLKKYPEHARDIWITTWNEVYNKTKDEEKAFKIAWNSLQKYIKKQKESK